MCDCVRGDFATMGLDCTAWGLLNPELFGLRWSTFLGVPIDDSTDGGFVQTLAGVIGALFWPLLMGNLCELTFGSRFIASICVGVILYDGGFVNGI